ncbi:hypothetical protein Q4S26_20805, partial [Morganella morganii]
PYSFQFPIHSPMTAASANMLTVRAISLIGHILAKVEKEFAAKDTQLTRIMTSDKRGDCGMRHITQRGRPVWISPA